MLVQDETAATHDALSDEAEALFEEARVRARRRRRRGALVVVLVAAALALAFVSSGGIGGASTVTNTGGAGPLPPSVVRPAPATEIGIPSGAVSLAATGGALWVSGFHAVSKVDAASGRVVARITTPLVGDDSQIAAGAGSIWVTAGIGGGTVYRIDPSTNRVAASINIGPSAVGIAIGAGSVWVTRATQGVGELIRIDPQTNRVTGPAIQVGFGPEQVTYGQGAVWVEDTSPPSALRVDPATERADPAPAVGAIGHGSLWVASDDKLTRTDPKTGRIIASVDIPRARAVTTGEGEVWVLASPRSSSPTLYYPVKHTAALYEVDPHTNQIIGRPVLLNALQPIALTVGAGTLWIADYHDGTVSRLRLVR
jgi:DNA-binding beta-propeller fold protein YncE